MGNCRSNCESFAQCCPGAEIRDLWSSSRHTGSKPGGEPRFLAEVCEPSGEDQLSAGVCGCLGTAVSVCDAVCRRLLSYGRFLPGTQYDHIHPTDDGLTGGICHFGC